MSKKTFQTKGKEDAVYRQGPLNIAWTAIVQSGEGGLPVSFGPEPVYCSVCVIPVENRDRDRVINWRRIFYGNAGVPYDWFDAWEVANISHEGGFEVKIQEVQNDFV